MRIIAGKWKGRALHPVLSTLPIRPTSDRVRQATFNVLEHRFSMDWDTTRVLDICCGTGALGLESLSRGAAYATFVDNHPACLALARQNAEKLGALPQADFRQQDACQLSVPLPPYALVFFDPPYRNDILETVLERLKQPGFLTPDALLVLEHEKNYKILNKNIEILYEKEYNKTCIRYGRFRQAL